MAARFKTRILGIGLNLQILLCLISTFPQFMKDPVLLSVIIMSILATMCIDLLDILLLTTLDYPVLLALWEIIKDVGEQHLQALFILGCIVHMFIIQNQILINMI